MRKRKISKSDWLRRNAVPKYLETGVLPLHKHHTIPKHHGGENSPLLELNYKQHTETHLEYGKKHNCKRCLQSYKTLIGMWNIFIEEVEKYSEEKAFNLVDSYEDYLGKIDDEGDVNKDDVMLKEYVELEDVIDNSSTFKNPEDDIIKDSIKDSVRWSLETLSGRERSVLEMYFGINRDRSMRLNEIGEEFDLTRDRILQIKNKGLQRLQHRSRGINLLRFI